jgi:putative ABC transport system substrate-binding protein
MAIGIGRREFTAALGSAAVAWPLAARAQQAAMPVIGFLHSGSAEAELNRSLVVAFREGLSQTGYVVGRNIAIEYRWANDQYDRLPALAAELIRRQVNVIEANTPLAALAAKRATTSIPIVFSLGSDPVKDGLVASLNRPGGNITGATFFANLLDAKRLDLLHQLVPNATLFGALVNPKNVNADQETHDVREAALALGLEIAFAQASTESEIDQSLANLSQQHAAALVVAGDSFLSSHAGAIAKLAVRYSLPTAFTFREHVMAGGLMSYGASITDTNRQAGNYVGRILKGEKPGDLPVQQPSKFQFIVNMKTAKALGLNVPYSIQMLADEVIE